MRIDRKLNLIIPIETEENGKIFIHSTPISREVFETYFMVMSKTFAAIFTQGLGAIAGPRVAYLMLKQTANELGQWDSVRTGLINEIVRLSNIAYIGDQGWQSLPLHTAFERGILDEDARDDIEGELVFFTLVVRMMKRPQTLEMMRIAGDLWGSELTALDFTAYRNSLPTSMPAANTGAMATVSLLPA